MVALGKTPIVVNDSRGFFTSRVFGTYVMEGAAMLAEGIAAPLIEHAALAAGMPVGPLAVLDETSLSLSAHVLEQTRADAAAEGHDPRAHGGRGAGREAWSRNSVDLGAPVGVASTTIRPAQRNGSGPVWRRSSPGPGPATTSTTLKRRFLYRQSIETVRCLAEGVLTSVAEANIGSILGIGFPAWTGGAIQFIASEGRTASSPPPPGSPRRHGDRFAVAADSIDAALGRA